MVAFDQSPKSVDLARARLGDSADIRVHDLAEPLSWLKDESFDAAVLALVLHHLDDRVAALSEIRRVLRPGGHLVVSTTHPTGEWLNHGGSYFAVEVVEETWSKGWEMRYWRLPLEAICQEFHAAGYLIERLAEPRPVPEMADRYPDYYEQSNRQPGFIAFRLVKGS